MQLYLLGRCGHIRLLSILIFLCFAALILCFALITWHNTCPWVGVTEHLYYHDLVCGARVPCSTCRRCTGCGILDMLKTNTYPAPTPPHAHTPHREIHPRFSQVRLLNNRRRDIWTGWQRSRQAADRQRGCQTDQMTNSQRQNPTRISWLTSLSFQAHTEHIKLLS